MIQADHLMGPTMEYGLVKIKKSYQPANVTFLSLFFFPLSQACHLPYLYIFVFFFLPFFVFFFYFFEWWINTVQTLIFLVTNPQQGLLFCSIGSVLTKKANLLRLFLNTKLNNIDALCTICNYMEELVEHALLNCNYARSTWFGSQLSLLFLNIWNWKMNEEYFFIDGMDSKQIHVQGNFSFLVWLDEEILRRNSVLVVSEKCHIITFKRGKEN